MILSDIDKPLTELGVAVSQRFIYMNSLIVSAVKYPYFIHATQQYTHTQLHGLVILASSSKSAERRRYRLELCSQEELTLLRILTFVGRYSLFYVYVYVANPKFEPPKLHKIPFLSN